MKIPQQDQVAFIFQSMGDVTNAAVQRYLNDRHIPLLFLAAGSSKWADPQHFPWSMPWHPSLRTEGHVHARYILDHKPDAQIAVLVPDSLDFSFLGTHWVLKHTARGRLRVISGILHRFRERPRWRAIPAEYGPPTTLFNCFNCWSQGGPLQALFAVLAACGDPPLSAW